MSVDAEEATVCAGKFEDPGIIDEEEKKMLISNLILHIHIIWCWPHCNLDDKPSGGAPSGSVVHSGRDLISPCSPVSATSTRGHGIPTFAHTTRRSATLEVCIVVEKSSTCGEVAIAENTGKIAIDGPEKAVNGANSHTYLDKLCIPS